MFTYNHVTICLLVNNSWAQAGKRNMLWLEPSLKTRMGYTTQLILNHRMFEGSHQLRLHQTQIVENDPWWHLFQMLKYDFALMYMHMHMNYFLSRSLLSATWSTTVSSSACPLGPAPLAAVRSLVCRVGSRAELWIEYLNVAECKEHRWPACFMVVNVTITVLHNLITKWENWETLCY